MPKKLFAVTNVKFSGDPADFVPAGEVLDPSKFSKEQLVQLHDAGAIEVRLVEDEDKPAEKLSPLDDPDANVVDPAAEAKAKADAEEKATADAKAAADKQAADDKLKAETAPKTTPTSTPAKPEGTK